MAKLVFGMMQSLDGYVDNMKFAPGPALFRHFIEEVRGLTGCVYGRRMLRSCVIETKIVLIGLGNATSRRRGEAIRSGSCRAR
jgi:hypothetical protein